MRAVVVRSLVVIATGVLVLVAVLYIASTIDARNPEVVEVVLTQPLADDPDMALITTSIEIIFSEPVETDGAVDAVVFAPRIDGSVSWSGSTLTFTPSQPLELETEYRLTIGPGISDLTGNEMTEVPEPYEFATAGRPTLATSEPSDDATDVPVDAELGLVFSGLMDTASVEAVLEVRPAFAYDVRWSGELLELRPVEPLDSGTEYRLTVGPDATDVAGVAIGEAVSIGFRTVAPGLAVERVMPADRADGISPLAPIAIVFDRAIDPASVDDELLVVTPDVSGSLDLVGLPDDPGGARMLRFMPSAPLPPNTTVTVELASGLEAEAGGRLAEPVAFEFTTGAPQAILSNQVLFLSARGGVANVWAMNPDGTGQHQVSAELVPVLDYAVAPNGASLAVSDGRRLIFLRADGSERRVLTDEAHLEFDPAYAPNGSRIAYARADAETGRGMGLWTWEIGAASATRLELPRPLLPGNPASPGASGDEDDESDEDEDEARPLRAPRYAPDGQALAFVDPAGTVGLLELPAQRLTLVEASAAGAPAWDAGSSAVLVPVAEGSTPLTVDAPVAPLTPGEPAEAGVIRRSGTRLEDADIGAVRRLATAADGRVAWIDAAGQAWIAPGLGERGDVPDALEGDVLDELAFGPSEGSVIVVSGATDEGGGTLERIDLDTGRRTELVTDGWHVRWLP